MKPTKFIKFYPFSIFTVKCFILYIVFPCPLINSIKLSFITVLILTIINYTPSSQRIYLYYFLINNYLELVHLILLVKIF
nr:MAG TPA: hypothetical protein [Siphoviridae sp. ctza41]